MILLLASPGSTAGVSAWQGLRSRQPHPAWTFEVVFLWGAQSATLPERVYETELPEHNPTGPIAALTHQLV